MRLLPTVVLSTLLFACASTPATRTEDSNQSPSIEKAVLEVEDAWMDALVRRDTATMDRLLAPEFVLSGSAPVPETRAQYLDSTPMPERTLEPLRPEGREVRVYGTTALSMGAVHLRGKWGERKLDLRYRYTNIYVRRDGRWQAVASHLSTFD